MIVVVTGATGAVGRATCARLRDRGDTVVAVGTDGERLETVAASGRLVADLTDPQAARRLAAEVVAAHRRVDVVLHLVGGWKPGSCPPGRPATVHVAGGHPLTVTARPSAAPGAPEIRKRPSASVFTNERGARPSRNDGAHPPPPGSRGFG